MEPTFDVCVEVNEVESGGFGKCPSEGRFAAAHESYEKYRSHTSDCFDLRQSYKNSVKLKRIGSFWDKRGGFRCLWDRVRSALFVAKWMLVIYQCPMDVSMMPMPNVAIPMKIP